MFREYNIALEKLITTVKNLTSDHPSNDKVQLDCCQDYSGAPIGLLVYRLHNPEDIGIQIDFGWGSRKRL